LAVVVSNELSICSKNKPTIIWVSNFLTRDFSSGVYSVAAPNLSKATTFCGLSSVSMCSIETLDLISLDGVAIVNRWSFATSRADDASLPPDNSQLCSSSLPQTPRTWQSNLLLIQGSLHAEMRGKPRAPWGSHIRRAKERARALVEHTRTQHTR